MLAVETRGLHKVYLGAWGRGGVAALRGVDLVVPQGSAFGLIGRNGAGKTTFIKLLLAVVHPTKGSVAVLGGNPTDCAVRRRIGYLPERLHLPASWRPDEFLASIARLKNLARPQPEIAELLARVGLGPDRHRKIGGFSKGMRQRLGLAAALLGKPDILVLDEPTDGIDPIGRREVRQILLAERARGATLFLNSHLLSETERICDRIGILSGGLLAREGSLEELCQSANRWRVRFAPGFDEASVRAAGFAPAADAWTLRAETIQALNDALDQARRSGALVVEVRRDDRDLEEVFADTLEAA